MHEIDGYTLGKPLHASGRSEVLAATRDRDGTPVVLKRYCNATGEEGVRTRREFEMLRRLAAPGIVRAEECVATQGQTILVMESIPGPSLAHLVESAGPVTDETFLWIALGTTEALQYVHAARLLHRDIKPRNILVTPQSREVHLIDFGLAASLGDVKRPGPGTTMNGLDGTLLYIAPEQTGRMDRGVDFRSDLYSLGATFYHLLTGGPPFPIEDPLALIHAHIARTATAPHAKRPEISPTISRIVMKLLEKEPERRYQTAAALANDLRTCREQLERDGTIALDLVLGGADGPYRPLFSQTLYGREEETERLHAAYARVIGGTPALVELTGPPGVGKSALVAALRPRLLEDRGALAVGKFDPYGRDRPYTAIRAALDSLVQQWLAEPEDQLTKRARELRESLGPIAAVMIELVPDLALVVGEVPSVPPVGPSETQNRLCVAIERFMAGCATAEHPLVLLLDDIQWADPGSRLLIDAMLTQRSPAALLVVATHGGPETGAQVQDLVSAIQARGVAVFRIELPPLTTEACAEMLAEALRRTPADTHSLARCVERKTGSLPLQVQQLVELMHARGLIEYRHPIGWVWDEAQVEGAEIPDSAVAIMTEKIGQLTPPLRDLLSFVSCVGSHFDLEALAELTERPRADVDADIFALSDIGLLVPSNFGFKFAHDRIRDAAQSLLPESARAAIHHRVAMRMLATTRPDQLTAHAFDIADHLNRAEALLDAGQRATAFEVNARAGLRALAEGAATTAMEYLRPARSMLDAGRWDATPDLCFELFLAGAESAFQTRQFDEALSWLDALDGRPLATMQAVKVAMKRIAVTQIHRPMEEALSLVLDTAERFGVRWPRRPSWLRVCYAMLSAGFMLRGCAEQDFFRPVAPKDVHRLAGVFVLSTGGTVLSRASIRFTCMLTALALQRYRRYGYAYPPSFALACYGAFRLAFFGRGAGLQRFAQAALLWSRWVPDARFGPRAEIAADGYIGSWFRPRRGIAERIRPLAQQSLESGDLEYLLISEQIRANLGALCGEPLEVVARLFEDYYRAPSNSPVQHLVGQPYLLLSSPETSLEQIDAALEEARRAIIGTDSTSMYLSLSWMVALTVLGRFDAALAMSEVTSKAMLQIGAMTSHAVDYMLYRGLAAAAVARTTGRESAKAARAIFRSCHRRLRTWSGYNPDFQHMERLLHAERCALRGRSDEAVAVYKAVAARAIRQGYAQHAAIAHERRATLLRRMRRDVAADAALQEAFEQYRIWGAHAKLAQLVVQGRRNV